MGDTKILKDIFYDIDIITVICYLTHNEITRAGFYKLLDIYIKHISVWDR